MLTVVDALLSEYGWSLDYVLFDLPLAQAFALYAAISARYGNEAHAPTFAEMDLLDELTGGDSADAPRSPRVPRRRRLRR